MRDIIEEKMRIIKAHSNEANFNIASLFNKIILTIKMWLCEIKNKVTGQNLKNNIMAYQKRESGGHPLKKLLLIILNLSKYI